MNTERKMRAKILIVDDTKANLQILSEALRDEYTIFIAMNGPKAIENAKHNTPDLILLDIMMPEMDGYEVITRLRETQETKDIPVIFITAMTEEEDEAKGFELGAIDYITKPLSLSVVKQRVRTHVRLKHYQDYLEERVAEELAKRKQQEQLLTQQSKMAAMGELIGMIAHQWRQPLGAITAISAGEQMNLQLENEDRNELLASFKRIDEQARYLSETITDFRNFFRPDKATSRVNLANIIAQTMKIIGKALEKADITVTHEYAFTKTLETYANELIQVFINILKNALDQFITQNASKREIIIRGEERDDACTLSFEDTAGGIPDDVLPHVFDEYFTTKGEKTGTGLGLSMSKTIIEEHCGGSIVADNTEHGAVFRITLPA